MFQHAEIHIYTCSIGGVGDRLFCDRDDRLGSTVFSRESGVLFADLLTAFSTVSYIKQGKQVIIVNGSDS